ncbi:MAG: putative transport system permease protein [bacterium]
MSALWLVALARLRAARRRSPATVLGILAAATLLGAVVTVGHGLRTGFDRSAARADLPDVIARFDARSRADVDRRLRALPGVESRAYRFEATGVRLGSAGASTRSGAVEVVGGGRRGYAIVAGHDVRGSGPGVVVERGLADAWHLDIGDELFVGRLGSLPIAGIAVEPDNVAFPLASTAHVYLASAFLDETFGRDRTPSANVALVWLHDGASTATFLQQARASSYGVTGLRFVTRRGIRVQLDDAAGIVVALLGAVALVGLIAAAVLIAAGAQADVQRGLATIGIQRAIGLPGSGVAGGWALSAVALALPAGAAGLALGAAVAYRPTEGLLGTLNEQAAGRAVLAPLVLALLGVVALVATCTAWPAWRAARRSPVALLRGADLTRVRRVRGLPAGPALLGVRLALARRGRALTTTAVLAATGAVLVLMLALGSLLSQLRDDPGALGKRYEIIVPARPDQAGAIARIPGVRAAASRYTVEAADSFALGEPLRVIAYPGDHTPFEAAPLTAGRRVRGDAEAEVGQGLADALGLHVGGTLAVQLPSGSETRFRVVGVVRALDHDGRVVYVRAARLLRADPRTPSPVAVVLAGGADQGAVRRAITARTGLRPQIPSGSTTRDRRFLGTLSALVRAIAGVIAIVCLYALVQALAILAREQRATVSVLRASGAGIATVGRVLAGAALAVALPAVAGALALELAVLGPAVTRLAAGYADLSLVPSAGQGWLFGAGFVALALAAATWVAVATGRQSIVTGLRSE